MQNINQLDWRAKPNVLSQPEILNVELQDAQSRGDTQNAGYLRNEMSAGKVQESPVFKVKAPDGSIINVNAPPGATEEQAIEFAAATWKPAAPAAPKSPQAAPKPQPGFIANTLTSRASELANLKSTTTDTLAGIGAGVGDVGLGLQKFVGKTINAVASPQRTLSSLVLGKKNGNVVGDWLVNDAERGKKNFDAELAPHAARSPIATPVGRIGGNVAATLPVGGVLGQVATKAGLPALGTALRTGGFRTGLPAATTLTGKVGQMALRSGAAAVPAYAAQTMIDGGTENAGTAATIAAMLPPGLKIAGEAGKAIKKGTGGLVKHTLGMTTGTGAESVSAAYNAGKNKSTAFLDNMRGNVPFDDVVNQAKGALSTMRVERGNVYRSGMVDISNDKAVVDFKPISDAVSKVSQMGSYKGQQINKNAAGTVSELTETIDNWASLNPAEYHTPEGLDALKQAIGDIRDTTQFGTQARRSADAVYNAVKDQITAQAPTYAKVMKDYSEASKALQDAEQALSLGKKASADTSIRKLQSLMRNNAQTNYGNRLNIAKNLEDKGGVELLPAIAGQSMNAVMPRGITGAIQKGGALLTAGATGGASIVPTMLAAPFASPRLVGEALYGMGRLNGGAGSIAAKTGLTPAQLARRPGLLEAQGLLYRTAPVMATSQSR